jgi:hypothetical protein
MVPPCFDNSLNQQRKQKRPAPFGPGTSLFRYSDCNLKHPNVGTSGAVATMGDRLPGRLGPASKREPLISLLAQHEKLTRDCTQQGHGQQCGRRSRVRNDLNCGNMGS